MKCRIEKIVNGGRGLGYSAESGRTPVFVPFTCPGETVDFRTVYRTKKFILGLPDFIANESKERVKPVCEAYYYPGRKSPYCGGCDMMHLNYNAQLEYKKKILAEMLKHNGLDGNLLDRVRPSPMEKNYRNKIQLPVKKTKNGLSYGFYMPYSHTMAKFNSCHVQSKLLASILASVLKLGEYLPDNVRNIVLRASERTGDADMLIVTSGRIRRMPSGAAGKLAACGISGLYSIEKDTDDNSVLDGRLKAIEVKKKYTEEFLGKKIHIPPGSFFQLNTACAEELFLEAEKMLRLKTDDIILDLYCGVGAFSVHLAPKVKSVFGLEISRSSVQAAKENACFHRVNNVSFYESDAGKIPARVRELSGSGIKAVVDPPRSGLGISASEALLRMNPSEIIYISCDPATFIRDCLYFVKRGFSLADLQTYDFFPMTHHIELLARFVPQGIVQQVY